MWSNILNIAPFLAIIYKTKQRRDLMTDNTNDIRQRIAKLLRFYREKAGLTTQEAGELCGKSKQTISAWEAGRGQPDADMLLKICSIYKIESISVFFEDNPGGLKKDEIELLYAWRNASEAAKEAAMLTLKSNKKVVEKKEQAV